MYQQIIQNVRQLARKTDVWVAVLAGLVYSSWPLGFVLNPLVARHDFASALEATHQPYNWVFITMDVLSGVLLCGLGVLQWRKSANHMLLRLSVLAYVLFGLFVILAAVAPDGCPTGAACAAALHNPVIFIHGVSSIISVVFLVGSLLLPLRVLLAKRYYYWAMLLALFVVVGWGLTGVAALVVMSRGLRDIWLQYNLISLCSVSLIVCAAIVERLGNPTPRKKHSVPVSTD